MKAIFVFAAFLFAFLSAASSRAAAPSLDIRGVIKANSGIRLSNVTVSVYKAKPKEGAATISPFDYPDCFKQCQTDAEGKFRIVGVDPKLKFELLVTAEKYESQLVMDVDPTNGIKRLSMRPWSEEVWQSTNRIKGLIVGDDGNPIPRAIIFPNGVSFGPRTWWGGHERYVDSLAVADDHGVFTLHCRSNTVTMVHLTIEGKGCAKTKYSLPPGEDCLLRLPVGVEVKGRLVRKGRPVAKAIVATSTTSRNVNEHLSGYEAETDSDGRFVLKNLPPGREFSLYTLMRSMGDRGALPRKVYTTKSSGATQDLGNVEVEPAFKLAGRIVFSDGHKLPKGQKISLSREDAWDNAETELDSDGSFEFKAVPAECIGLWFRPEGYKFSTKNPSLDWLNGRILGRMTPETGHIDLLMEPGTWRYREEGSPPEGRSEYPREVPLSGVKLEKK